MRRVIARQRRTRFPVRAALDGPHQHLVEIALGPRYMFFVFQLTHPDHIHQVLVEKSKSFRKPGRLRCVLGQWNGNGLAVNEGESWVRQRRLTNPAFKPQRLARYVEIVNRRTADLLATWRERSRVEASADIYRVTLGVVAEALFGSDVERHTERFAREVATLNLDGLKERPWPCSRRSSRDSRCARPAPSRPRPICRSTRKAV